MLPVKTGREQNSKLWKEKMKQVSQSHTNISISQSVAEEQRICLVQLPLDISGGFHRRSESSVRSSVRFKSKFSDGIKIKALNHLPNCHFAPTPLRFPHCHPRLFLYESKSCLKTIKQSAWWHLSMD